MSEPGALVLAATHGGKDTQFVAIGQDVIHLPEQSIDKDELDLILRKIQVPYKTSYCCTVWQIHREGFPYPQSRLVLAQGGKELHMDGGHEPSVGVDEPLGAIGTQRLG